MERSRSDLPADSLRVNRVLSIPLTEITIRASRSSGPGGQHANVTSSRIEVVFDVTSSRALSDRQRALLVDRVGTRVVAVAQDERSQLRNRELALSRLARRLRDGLTVAPVRHPTRPTAASRRRRLDAKRRTARLKLDRRRPPSEN